MIERREAKAVPLHEGETVRLEIDAPLLARLLVQGHLRVADLRCLDCASMHCLRRSCLECCVWRESGPGTAQGPGRRELDGDGRS